ncbi:MAG: short-chain alcohol dehydrogenase [Verrucomicrobiales bacterium]|nr:short-chain alcohol dehydrogenase [Verrucomicrobiales bacterium]
MAKFVLITGATQGLGRAMLEGFAKEGCTVAGCGRSADAISELRMSFPMPHTFEAVDVSQDDVVSRWAKKLLQSHGAPDLLINNAAIINRNAPLWTLSAPEFDKVIDINIKGVSNVIRHFVPAMIARKTGVIVNFSSGWGRSVAADVAPYCATKWAIEGLTKALSLELPDGMAAVPLNPGIIATDMLRSTFGGSADGYPSPSDWASRAVPFILSISSRNSGESLSVPE